MNNCTDFKNKLLVKMDAHIEIKHMPKMYLAYVTCIGPQNLERSYEKLIQWATSLGLMGIHTKPVTMYHDSFKDTEYHKVWMSACLMLKEPVNTEGEIKMKSIDSGKYIVGRYEIGMDEFAKSWTELFGWMNDQGYRKADKEPFEIYYNNFKEHPEQKAIIDLCIPIQ